MKNPKGFTLIEVLITMVIMVAVFAMTIPMYNSTVKSTQNISMSEESKIDHLLAMEMIRLDLQHVGTGIGQYNSSAPLTGIVETTSPIVYAEPTFATTTLDLRSTLINTNQSTLGWALINCTVGGAAITAGDYIVDQREDTTNNQLVLLDSGKGYVSNTNAAYNCPALPGIYTAFPNSNGVNACAVGFCTNIRYSLSATANDGTSNGSSLETCAVGTRNLLRVVGGAAGDSLVNCVAGLKVRFDIDSNDDGNIDAPLEIDQSVLPGTASLIMSRVKNIDMYLLVQVGKEDSTLNSQPTLIDPYDPTVDFTADLATITNPSNYRWKIFKVSGKPNSWL